MPDEEYEGPEVPWVAWNLGRGWWLFVECYFCTLTLTFGPLPSPEAVVAAAGAAEGVICEFCAAERGCK